MFFLGSLDSSWSSKNDFFYFLIWFLHMNRRAGIVFYSLLSATLSVFILALIFTTKLLYMSFWGLLQINYIFYLLKNNLLHHLWERLVLICRNSRRLQRIRKDSPLSFERNRCQRILHICRLSLTHNTLLLHSITLSFLIILYVSFLEYD